MSSCRLAWCDSESYLDSVEYLVKSVHGVLGAIDVTDGANVAASEGRLEREAKVVVVLGS